MIASLRCCCLLLVVLSVTPSWGKVVVLANRTVETITVEVTQTGETTKNLTIASGDSQPVFFSQGLRVGFGYGLQQQEFSLQGGSAYFFTRGPDGEGLELEQIGLGEQTDAKTEQQESPQPSKLPDYSKPVTITVKLLVDDNEPSHRQIWESKLRKRVADASEILERHSGIRLKVIEVDTWESNDEVTHFGQTLREFETKVKAAPAQLVLGFSSQYQAMRGRSHLGITRWPMHSHILLRERSHNLLEVERLELLVHELGHYLGASHSPEPQSVMRPVLTRGPQRRVGSRIQFDPVNALIIALVGDEMRQNDIRSIQQISKPTADRLKVIYEILKQAMPSDPAAGQYLRLIELVGKPPATTTPEESDPGTSPLVRDTKIILDHLLQFAQVGDPQQETQPEGDELTNAYVRQAALAASRIRTANAKRAMLLALGIFFDDTLTLRTFPGTRQFIEMVEPDDQRALRIEAMGKPTMRERADLAKHFFVSAHLVVAGGKIAAAGIGLAKEHLDSQSDSGFSFVDLAADQAGIEFADALLNDKLSLLKLAKEFHVDDYLPTLVGLDEGLTAVDLRIEYGGTGQSTIAAEIEKIKQRILDLPIYDSLEQ